jgi:M-phase inducer tyrosine phosphatase
MDDPLHFERRNSDLHDFRKFSRTRSFTYGETQTVSSSSRAAPPCPPLAFAAASAAQGRRDGPTIDEDDEHDSSPSGPSGSGEGSGMEASPCPRVCSMGTAPIFGSAKTRTLGRVGMGRTASYAGTTFGR